MMRLSKASWAGSRVLILAPTPTHPLDFGNRRRIFHIADALKADGAEIHYVHYPAEQDWRQAPPLAAMRAMQACWVGVYTVPVTRPLHAMPIGAHHSIDEWWDPAIGQMLEWLFATWRFDVMIVNYTWLSRALEFAPHGVLRVLDTHDRFSGRRELLEARGIGPEFFFTTEAEEKIGLERADLVWAIKDEERAFFARLVARPVITVPHAEPLRPMPPRRPGEIMRFGIVGARNNVNLANFRAFLTAAQAFIHCSLLPCEFHIAGSCCEDLRAGDWPPWVVLHGRVPSLEEFYRAVDVVLAPMEFSTGLKIRVGEALALGRAMIAHAHAFEGYPATHPFQQMESFPAMLAACEAVVAQPAVVAEMEEAACRAAVLIGRQVSAGLAVTQRLGAALRQGLLMVLDVSQLDQNSLVLDHVCETADYLCNLLPVTILLTGRVLGTGDTETGWRLWRSARVMCTPEVPQAGLKGLFAKMPGVISLDEALAVESLAVWLASPLPEDVQLGVPAYLPQAVWAAQLPDPSALERAVAQLGRWLPELRLLGCSDSVLAGRLRKRRGVTWRRVPTLVRGVHADGVKRCGGGPGEVISALVDHAGDPLTKLLIAVAEAHGHCMTLLLPGQVAEGGVPALVLDAASAPGHDLLRETLDMAGIPRVALFQTYGDGGPWRVAGLLESVLHAGQAMRDMPRLQSLAKRRAQHAAAHRGDGGWAGIWAELSQARHAALWRAGQGVA